MVVSILVSEPFQMIVETEPCVHLRNAAVLLCLCVPDQTANASLPR